MTDHEQAEIIANHEGWGKYCRENWVWKIDDIRGYFRNGKLVTRRILRQRTVDLLNESKGEIHIPIPDESRLMDMLKAMR